MQPLLIIRLLFRLRPLSMASLISLVGFAQPLPAAAGDLVDTMIEMRPFCVFLGAIRAAGLEQELRGPGPFTLLAPTDEAFAAMPSQIREPLMQAQNREALAATIRRHLLLGRVTARALGAQRRWVETAAGVSILIDGTSGQLMVDDGIEVLAADIAADNGVLHIIDTVMLPD